MSMNTKMSSNSMKFLQLAVGATSVAYLSGCQKDNNSSPCPGDQVVVSDTDSTCVCPEGKVLEANKTCVEKPHKTCSSDNDCVNGEVCNTDKKTCEPKPDDKNCPEKQHYDGKKQECVQDGDDKCSDSNPCPGVKNCEDGQCVDPSPHDDKCTSDDQCQDNQECNAVGECVDDCDAIWKDVTTFVENQDNLSSLTLMADLKKYKNCEHCMEENTAEDYKTYVFRTNVQIMKEIARAKKHPSEIDFTTIAKHFITQFQQFGDDLKDNADEEKKARDAVYAGSVACGGPSGDDISRFVNQDTTKDFLKRYGMSDDEYANLIKNLD